jgi:sulfatase modifying factor 1
MVRGADVRFAGSLLSGVTVLVLAASGCEVVLGIDEDYEVGPSGGAGGTASTTGGDGGSAVGGTGGGGAQSGGEGGAGASGGGPVTCPSGMADLSTYCIDTHEVTNAEYQAFLDDAPSTSDQPPECVGNASFTPSAGWPAASPTLPVTNVDWCDAKVYCLSVGKRLCGRVGGGSIPTMEFDVVGQSQWFDACSQGGVSEYAYGDAYVGATCVGNGYDGVDGYNVATDVAQPVGSAADCHGASAPYDEVYDLNGNVAEWVDSCSANKCSTAGGSFDGGVAQHRCRATTDEFFDLGYPHVGIRCCAE